MKFDTQMQNGMPNTKISKLEVLAQHKMAGPAILVKHQTL
jgi:hypothetical protein